MIFNIKTGVKRKFNIFSNFALVLHLAGAEWHYRNFFTDIKIFLPKIFQLLFY